MDAPASSYSTYRTWMPPLPATVHRGMHYSRTEKVVKSEIEHDLSFMVPDRVYKFQMICFRGT